jgi:hypothetical protein
MKKLMFYLLMLTSLTTFSQESEISLDPLFKIEAGLHGIGIAFELPLAEKFTIDLSTGFGAQNNNAGYELSTTKPISYFAKSTFKYFYNRQKRLDKKKRLANNAGSYLAFQTKFNNNASGFASALLNEVHWGKQAALGERFLVEYHFGIGHYKGLRGSNTQTLYPAIGLKFSYVIF